MVALFVMVVPFTATGGQLTPKALFSTMTLVVFLASNVILFYSGILRLSDAVAGIIRIGVSAISYQHVVMCIIWVLL